MVRYIDADALYKETEKKIAEANSYRMAVVDDEFLDLINDAFTEDVAPKAEVARELLSDLKKTVHDKAVYSYSKEMYPYINLKVFDAIIADYLKRLEEKNNG